MDFPEIELDYREFTTDELERGDKVRANIGEVMTDIRLVMVVKTYEEEKRVDVILPGNRLDGPYNVPVENIMEMVEKK